MIKICLLEDDLDTRDLHDAQELWIIYDPERKKLTAEISQGTPFRVFHAIDLQIASVPRKFVGLSLLLDRDTLKELCAPIQAAWRGSEWNGANMVGSWDTSSRYPEQELKEYLEEAFRNGKTWWEAADYFGAVTWPTLCLDMALSLDSSAEALAEALEIASDGEFVQHIQKYVEQIRQEYLEETEG